MKIRNPRHGTIIEEPEWNRIIATHRPIPGYEEYYISEHGDIWKMTWGKRHSKWGSVPPHKLDTWVDTMSGYLVATLTDYKYVGEHCDGELILDSNPRLERVHILVAKAYIGPSPSPNMMVCHKNGVKADNHYSNLYWGTSQTNADDAKWHRKVGKGRSESVRPALRQSAQS